jgi:hypothetical protein
MYANFKYMQNIFAPPLWLLKNRLWLPLTFNINLKNLFETRIQINVILL